MATVLVSAPPAQPSSVPDHHRLRHILTQPTTFSTAQLKQIHAQILRTELPPQYSQETLFLYSRLIHFSSLQDITYTSQLFNQIQNPNTFIYNTVIRANAHSKNHKRRAFLLFQELLKDETLLPDKHTFPFVLKACAYLFSLGEGKQAHAHVLKRGFSSDVYINNSLVHFYSSCGCSESSRKVFDKMPERTLVSWNVIIDSLVQMREFEEAVKLFTEMNNWFEPDGYTLQSVIDACAGLTALSMGMWIHAYILKKCKIDASFDTLIHNSLVEMYCKCGSLAMAQQVFDRMRRNRDVNSWNAMILGYAVHGEAERVFEHFTQMVDEENLKPNSITFVGVLSACNHRGLVEKGREYFDIMVKKYRIEPVLQHYGCLIDLLARGGKIEEAFDVISSMSMKPDAVIWRSILTVISKHCEGLELTEEMVRKVIEKTGERESSGAYVLLSRVYASANRWNEVGLIRKLMSENGVSKEPGCSLIEINGIAHEFFAGDTTHPRTKEIYEFLKSMEERVKLLGYKQDFSEATMVDEVDEGKGKTLMLHSERLAVAFGLLNSKQGVPIRVFKNLRICSDCHSYMKLVSKSFNVEIIMRDRIRFHCFKNGTCSCKDFW